MRSSRQTVRAVVALLGLGLIVTPALTADDAGELAAATELDRIAAGVLVRRTLSVAGMEREYRLYRPAAAARGATLPPAIIALHGGRGTAKRMHQYFGLKPVADRDGILLVYPQGIDNGWNDGRAPNQRWVRRHNDVDDVAFLDRLAAHLTEQGLADARRIYVTGLSNGGGMTLRMACEAPDRFAAFAPMIAPAPVTMKESCRPPRALPMLLINGTENRLVPYDGAATRAWDDRAMMAAPDHWRFWAERNGCAGAPDEQALPDRDPGDGTTIRCSAFTNCRDGTSVELLTIEGGGHQSPSAESGSRFLARFLGRRSRDIEAAETAWEFFRRFSL